MYIFVYATQKAMQIIKICFQIFNDVTKKIMIHLHSFIKKIKKYKFTTIVIL